MTKPSQNQPNQQPESSVSGREFSPIPLNSNFHPQTPAVASRGRGSSLSGLDDG